MLHNKSFGRNQAVWLMLATLICCWFFVGRNSSIPPSTETYSARDPKNGQASYNLPTSQSFPVLPDQKFSWHPSQVVEERLVPHAVGGGHTRQRVIKRKGKFAWLRIEEDFENGNDNQPSDLRMMAADHLLVKRRENVSDQEFLKWAADATVTVSHPIAGSDGLHVIGLADPSLAGFDAALSDFNTNEKVLEYAEPDYFRLRASTASLTKSEMQWAHHNTGQTGGKLDADVDAQEAWTLTQGNTALTVAVLDSGVDVTHEALNPNLWINPGEIAGNNIDDDSDGMTDNVNGWNFVSESKDLTDPIGHGTHCAGILGARSSNGSGLSGISPLVKIMTLKVMDGEGLVSTSDFIAALGFAARERVPVVSCSFGGTTSSKSELTALETAHLSGVLCVCASGNNRPARNLDSKPIYPASYKVSNIISVGASTDQDSLAAFSNYGVAGVDLVAPGVGILSSVPAGLGSYSYDSGTSMAAPLVAGTCILVKAAHSGLSAEQVKAAVLNGVDVVPGLRGKVKTSGRLNAHRAVKLGMNPRLELTKTDWIDGGQFGTIGNKDRILNPGETVALVVTVKNVGASPLPSGTTQVSLPEGLPGLAVSRPLTSWGTLSPSQSKTNNTVTLPPFLFTVSADTAQTTFQARLTHQDSAGNVWTDDITVEVGATQALSGKVTTLTGGKPIKGAIVRYTGPVSGYVTTSSTGAYTAKLPRGTYITTASAKGFSPTSPQSVTLESGMGTASFVLSAGRLVATPTKVVVTQREQSSAENTITLKNTGDQTLHVAVEKTGLGNVADASFVSKDSYGNMLIRGAQSAIQPLPWQDGFENARTSLLPARYHEEWEEEDAYYIYRYVIDFYLGKSAVVSDTAAVGTRSLYYNDPWAAGFDNGMQRRLPLGTKPKSVSYWVRPGANTGNTAFFSLDSGSYNAYLRTWSWGTSVVTIAATAGGYFEANGSLSGGDKSVPFTPKTWYKIELKNMDWRARTFDFWVNGTQIKTGIPFAGTATQVDRVHIYNSTIQGESWWDEFAVLDQDETWLTHNHSELTLAPGATADLMVQASALYQRPGTYQGQIILKSNDPVRPILPIPVTMKVLPKANTAPQAPALTVTVKKNTITTIELPVVDAEQDAVTTTIKSLPKAGELLLSPDGSGLYYLPTLGGTKRMVYYKPPADKIGKALASFTYQSSDYRSSATGKVTINVEESNTPPTVLSDHYTITDGSGRAEFNVLSNDSDADKHSLTATLTRLPIRGTAVLNSNGQLVYTASATFTSGGDSVGYEANDGRGGITAGIASIIVDEEIGNWTTNGGSERRDGYVSTTLGSAPLTELWSAQGSSGFAQPIVVNDKAYAFGRSSTNSTNRVVTAYLLTTGEQLWQRVFQEPGGTPFDPGYYSDLQYAAGRLYLNHQTNYVATARAIDAESGLAVWTKTVSAPSTASTYVTAYGSMLATESGLFLSYQRGTEQLSRLNLNTGNLELSAKPSASVFGYYMLSFGQGLLLSQEKETLNAANPTTGATSWSLTFPGQLILNPTDGPLGRGIACNDSIACLINRSSSSASSTTYLTCVDLTTHSTRWQLAGNYVGTPAIKDGRVYALEGSLVHEVDASNGTHLFSYSAATTEQLQGQPVLTDDSMIVRGTHSTWVFAYRNPTPRQQLPRTGALSAAKGRVLIAEGSQFICYGGGTVAALPGPVVNNLQFTGDEDLPVPIRLISTDAGPVKFRLQSLPTGGALFQTPDGSTQGSQIKTMPASVTNAEGRIIFVPAPNLTGNPATGFGFKAYNSQTISSEATVSISLNPVNDAPVAVDDHVSLRPGESLASFQPMANDFDVERDSMTIVGYTQPTAGTVTLSDGTHISYSPPAEGEIAEEQIFHYTIRDSVGQESTASIKISPRRQTTDGWLDQGGSASHAGFASVKLGSGSFIQSWERQMTSYDLQPTVAAGTVFLRHHGSVPGISAIDLASGWTRWTFTQPGATTVTTPVFHSGSIYYQWLKSGLYGSTGGVEANDAASGDRIWMRPFSTYASYLFSPSVTDQGIFLTRSSTSSLIGYDHMGRMRTYTSLDNTGSWVPTLAGEYVYGLTDGMFRAFFQRTGVLAWEAPISLPEYASTSQVATEENYSTFCYTSQSRSGVMCINHVSKTAQWEVFQPNTRSVGIPAIAQGRVYVCRNGDVIDVYNAETGVRERQLPYPSAGSVLEQPIVTADSILVPGSIVTNIVDLASGSVRQTLPRSGSLALYGQSLIIRSSDRITCYQSPDAFNPPPTADAQTVAGTEDTAAEINLNGQGQAGEQLTFFITSLPSTGALYQFTAGGTVGDRITSTPSLITNEANRVIFLPQNDLSGRAASVFSFAVSDGQTLSSIAAVTIDLAAVNDAPVAVKDKVFTRPGDTLSPVSERINDLDVDHDELTTASVTQPNYGFVAINSDGSLRYEASDSVNNVSDTFSYTITDPAGATSSAEITVVVRSIMSGEWTTAGGSAARSAHSTSQIAPGLFTQLWSTPITGNKGTSPAVAEEKVYTVVWDSGRPRITALSLSTGNLEWSTFLMPSSFLTTISPPTYHNGRVYATTSIHSNGSALQKLLCLNAQSGAILWSQNQPNTDASELSPAIADSGIFTSGGGSYGGLLGRNLAGDLLFSFGQESYGPWRPSIYGEHLYTLSTRNFSCLLPKSGASEWNIALSAPDQFADGHPATGAGCAAFTSGSAVHCVDLTTRASRWSHTSRYKGNPAISAGKIFAPNDYALPSTPCSVSAFDIDTGEHAGTYVGPGGTSLSVDDNIIATDDVVVFSTSHNTNIYDRKTRALRQTIPLSGSIALAGTTLLISHTSGVTAFTAPSPLTFSPPAGSYSAPVSVEVTAADPTSVIHFTLDGSAPRLDSPSVISGASVQISASSMIRALVTRGTSTSPVQSADYNLLFPSPQVTTPVLESAASVDTDHDGQNDKAELMAGTNPTNGNETFSISSATVSTDGQSVNISWSTVPGRSYRLQCSNDLVTWSDVSMSTMATASSMTQNLALQPDSRCFFRVMLE